MKRMTGWGIEIRPVITMGGLGMVVRTMTRRSMAVEVRTNRRMQEGQEVLMMMRRKWKLDTTGMNFLFALLFLLIAAIH